MSDDEPHEEGKATEEDASSQDVTITPDPLATVGSEDGIQAIGKPESQRPIPAHGHQTPKDPIAKQPLSSHDGDCSGDIDAPKRLSALQIRTPATLTGKDEHIDVVGVQKISDWSHQALAPPKEDEAHKQEEEWQDMPAVAEYDLYDDAGKLVARKVKEEDIEGNAYTGLGGAGKGYTRVQHDEDADSTSSMEDNTSYLFKQQNGTEGTEDDEEMRDTMAQMQATKDLLTEGQRIAYVGVTRLGMAEMVAEVDDLEITKGTKKEQALVVEAYKMWSQKMMVRLYAHMDISSSGLLPHLIVLFFETLIGLRTSHGGAACPARGSEQRSNAESDAERMC